MVTQTENFENISVNIYETSSFSKFDERDPDTNFLDDKLTQILRLRILNQTK